MTDAWVQLHCLECEKRWEDNPAKLPAPDTTYSCPDCDARATLQEFLLTSDDLRLVKEL